MALRYAPASGKMGVFAIVPGPGILNAIAALAAAAGSNIPILALTGQTPAYQIALGLGTPPELKDQTMALKGLVSWVERAETPAAAPALLAQAFQSMLRGRQQPAIFEMAPDILAKTDDVDLPDCLPALERPQPHSDAVDAAARLIGAARNPAIFVGARFLAPGLSWG